MEIEERKAEARQAKWDDSAPVSEMLGRAFFDDPLICFFLPDEETRPKKSPRLFRVLFRLGMPYGTCDVTTGHEAASIWRPPGRWQIPFYQYITNGRDFHAVFGARTGLRVMAAMDHIEKRHPKDPHYYLQVIGTDPAKQGKGFGGIAMRRHLAIADEKHLPAYLESSKEKNIPIYQSFGFEVTGEIRLPRGPVLYPMWRKARAG